MKRINADEKTIDISKIPDAPRYFFPVKYIFHDKYHTCSAYEKPDFETGFHMQEFYEICIISKGSGYHIIEDSVIKASIGDVFIVPPGRKHAFIGGKGFNVYYIHLSPVFLEQYSPRLRSLPTFSALFEVEPLMRVNGTKYRHLYLEEKVLADVIDILENLSKWRYGGFPDHIIHESYVLIALTILCQEYAKLQTTVGKNAHEDRLFMESVSAIIERFNENLTIENLAKIAKMSRTTYLKRFVETVGMPPRQFIAIQRIKMAKNLLRNTDKPLVKIAEETGFYDTSHFSKCFIASEGISPTEFRRSQNEQDKS